VRISAIRKADCEPCPRCGNDVTQDDENDWSHVLWDGHSRPIGLTLLCLDGRGDVIEDPAFYREASCPPT
jgi:hypothetical protein